MELKDVKENNEILDESQYLILHNDLNEFYKQQTIEISSSTIPFSLSLQLINKDKKMISSFEISERMAKQIISFLQNHFNL